MAKNIVRVLGWRPKHSLYPIGQQKEIWIPRVFERHDAEKCCLSSGVAKRIRIHKVPVSHTGCPCVTL